MTSYDNHKSTDPDDEYLGPPPQCPNCDGEGYIDEPVGHLFRQCPECEGTGEHVE